jgi:hypothetical protein
MSRTPLLLITCAQLIVVAPALAGILPPGPLATAPLVYVDGDSTVWHGSTTYSNTFGLSGFVDWAVWAPNTFPGFAGYTPNAGEYVYAYQAAVEGSAALSSFFVTLHNPANNIGTFSGDVGWGLVDGVGTNFEQILPFNQAEWYWVDGIPTDSRSIGLAFSSPNPPMLSDGTLIDHGSSAFAIPVPSPAVPEPASLIVWSLLGLTVAGANWRRRRMRS